MTETLGLHEAATFCRLHFQTLRSRAKGGKIPGASKPGKEWVFLRAGLVKYLEDLSPCRSTKLGPSITSICRPTAEGFDALLELPTKRKPRSTTKNSGASYGDRNG